MQGEGISAIWERNTWFRRLRETGLAQSYTNLAQVKVSRIIYELHEKFLFGW